MTERRDVHQLAEGRDGGLVRKRRAAGRHHHWIEDDWQLGLQCFEVRQPARNLLGSKGAADHSDLDRVDSESLTTASIWARIISAGIGWTLVTPTVFCAVMAVTAVIAWPPSMVTVLMSP